ncbi:MAG: IPT/TIG domain-containing protein [Anaerolineae bacterium]|nr:IPT/TIG domain-containing protein [Anaerolineae bacterium]
MHLQTHVRISKLQRRRGWLQRLFLALILLLLSFGPSASVLQPLAALAQEPTAEPTQAATAEPTQAATAEPTQAATAEPTQEPTAEPTQAATAEPTQAATAEPTQAATAEPTQAATAEPTEAPTAEPTEEPAPAPVEEVTPTAEPTEEPLPLPAGPTVLPTAEPSEEITPTVTATPELSFQVAAAPVYFVTVELHEYAPGPATGALITSDFTYLVNEDNAGDPSNPPSLKPMASHSPIVGAGNGTGGAVVVGLPDLDSAFDKFLISVRVNGYKLWGRHVTQDDDGQTVIIELIPEPLPRSKINVHVFHDNSPVNGEDDVPVETGLAGFHIVVEDTVGEVAVDWDGNPLCGGYCVTDANGNVTIDNLPYGKYEVIAIAPNGSDWVQTTTIEGTPVIDAWIEEGNDGNSPREGFQQAAVWIGFVRPMDNWDGPETGIIRGTVKYVIEYTPPINPLVLGEAVYKPWVALTDIGGNDQQVYLARGNENGFFQIDNVPDGEYQMAIWDQDLDAIISFRTITLAGGQTVDLGEFGIPRWFGWLSGYVFRDDDGDGNPNEPTDGNSIRDPGEPGIHGIDLAMRYRDGSVRYGAFTNESGFYEFPEVFELEKFYVAEVGFGRFARTGASVHDEFIPSQIKDHDRDNVPDPGAVQEGVLTLNTLQWAAKRTIVDWGKREYAPGENGGISGIVFYAVTRNEFNARLALNEDYEPGIPGVTMRLWGPGDDGILNTPDTPSSDDVLLNEVQTDSWEHPTGCDVRDSAGASLPDPLGLGADCIEVPNISNEVKEGVFDGGYAFESYWTPFFGAEGAVEQDGLPTGDYIVEVVTPPYYQILKEEDQNTDEGNEFVPAFPPAECVGPLHLVSDGRNPYDGQNMPLCNRRLVTLQDQQNAAADFFLFSDSDDDGDAATRNWTTTESVPTAGRIFGFLLDDLNVETDPNFIYYGEKRGIPNTSVGIRDFTGRLITMLTTDQNGIFEVVLPSTYTANCPIPSGVCPGMYRVIGNDPGDPDNPSPNFNPNYQTITFVFDVWPGKTTFADVALFPITAFTSFPGSQFGQPALCLPAADQPQVFVVDPPYGNAGSPSLITITGVGFGATQGSGAVTINGSPLAVSTWSDTSIEVTIPPGFANGPGQLLVTAGNGKVSQNGITFHVGVTTPDFIVDPGESIQAAIDAAAPGDLIVLTPGLHFGAINLNKAVTLQGYGPGANDGFGTGGSVLDQRFILDPVGINIVGGAPGQFTALLHPQIDGFRISNARDEQDVGGGVHVDLNGEFTVISNNVIQSNGGNFGGGITLGEPYRGDNNNDNIRILHNRILNNGGFSLAGGVGIFNGANDYEIAHNEICGNYSGEYGGGISHFGLSRRGQIHHNQVYFNNAFDEGGGVMIAGELPQPPATFTAGAGEVNVYQNLIQANMSNDDGGGVRLLQPLDFEINITNNMIVNNVATDFGGGIALDDASEVNIVNNTIARNANTSTSEDANGRHDIPNGAGIAVETYSSGFESYLGIGPGGYVDPVLFNNIICENQAYIWDGTNLLFDSIFDLQVFAGSPTQVLHPTASLLTDPNDTAQESFATHPTNLACGDLGLVFADTPDPVELDAVPFRMEPDFITVIMVTVPQPLSLQGDYHTQAGANAVDAGAATDPLGSGVPAACADFDGDGRPFDSNPVNTNGTDYDIGADEQPGITPPVGCSLGGPSNLPPVVDAGLALTITLPATATLTGTVSDDGLPVVPGTVTTTWSLDSGPLGGTVIFGTPTQVGPTPLAVNTTAEFSTAGVYTLTLTADDGQLTASDLITVTVNPSGTIPAADMYLSLLNNGAAGTLTGVQDEDIIGWTGGSNYVMVFDGSSAGLPGLDLDAFYIVPPNTILMSFTAGTNGIPGIPTTVDDSDIVQFTGTSFGLSNTVGTFSLFFDGSDVGLAAGGGEDIDGIELLSDNRLLISTSNAISVPGAAGADEDLLVFTPISTGPNTIGTWAVYFDGSDVGLGGAGEDVDGVSVAADGNIYLSTDGNFNVPSLSGADEDVFICGNSGPTLPTTGPVTVCPAYSLFFDGSANGIPAGNDLDAIELPN